MTHPTPSSESAEMGAADEAKAKKRRKFAMPGPWDDEPDELFWTDEKTGYECHFCRNHSGALCGYVRIPESHPLHGVNYGAEVSTSMKPLLNVVMDGPLGKRSPMQAFLAAGDITRIDILFDVHGGVTFSDTFDTGGYWYGFDCSHCYDLSPGYDNSWGDRQYRDVEYVKAECASLAKQLKQLAG